MIQFDPGSFKDPTGRVFLHEGRVCRTVSDSGRRAFAAARDSGLIAELVAESLIVDTTLSRTRDLGLKEAEVGEYVLHQPQLPFVSYSCEWSFEMLRDAALVTLRVLHSALGRDFILKDGNAYNIVFDGSAPRLVDVPSLEPYEPGQVWAGYSQFCRSFLFPLLLVSYRDLDVQHLLRGTFGELPVESAISMFGARDAVRPGVFRHVVLQARLERTFGRSQRQIMTTTSGHRLPKRVLVRNTEQLIALVEGLHPPRSQGQWSAYDTFHSYSEPDHAAKRAFVAHALSTRPLGPIVDLGCNTGEYSEVAAQTGAFVIALDTDPRAIDRLYRARRGSRGLAPVVASLLNPTPAMGWGLRERRSLLERLTGDSFLALALVHHLRITGGVPLSDIVQQLFAIAPEGVVEWVDKSDTMVAQMLSLRPDVYDDYSWPVFESLLREQADILAVQHTHGGCRRLCHVRARAGQQS
jgi:SAM-dependent methyltransferase